MTMLRDLVRAFPAIFRVAFAGMVAYRAEMIIWVLTATLPLVNLALWNAATADGPIAGFSQGDVARYYTTTLIVRQLTGTWIVWELNYLIRKGELSPRLLRPLNPLVWSLAETVAALPWRAMVLLPLVVGIGLWRPEIVFWPGATRALAFGVSVGFAFVLSWLVQVCFGMLAFWWNQSLGLFSAWFAIWSFFSGYFVPLPLLPPAVRAVTPYLPFHVSLGAPIDLVVAGAPIGETLLVQLVWVLVFAVLARTMWSAGIRRYGAVGA